MARRLERFYAYLLRCADGSYYAGFTTDQERRLAIHNAGKGAKYTRSRLPVTLAYLEEFESEHEARSREWHLKRLTHAEKAALAAGWEKSGEEGRARERPGKRPLGERSIRGTMLKHHEESIKNLVSYYKGGEGVIAVILDGSIVHGNARPDSDIDAVIVVTEEEYERRKRENRLAEVVTGHCTYEGGYFDVKFKSKKVLELAAERASEPTRNAYLGALTVYTADESIEGIVERISAYPEGEIAAKVRCFNGNLQLNRSYFLAYVKEDNAYMRAHLAQEIVYSVYRLILIENRVLFPCNRRLEDAVRACPRRPADILELGAAFLKDISIEKCEAFVTAFWQQSALPLSEDVSENYSSYVHYYEDWWMEEHPPFPNEW